MEPRSEGKLRQFTVNRYWRQAVVALLLAVLVYTILNNRSFYAVTPPLIILWLFGAGCLPQGPIQKPHPYFWRLVAMGNILFSFLLLWVLVYPDEAWDFLKRIGLSSRKPLKEKSYVQNCEIYDSDNPDDPWHALKENLDAYAIAHFLGWFVKASVVRNGWICFLQSIVFELMEYSMEHRLPSLSECWWDHWIIDCFFNVTGIWLGLKVLDFLGMERYSWLDYCTLEVDRTPNCNDKLDSKIDTDWRCPRSLQNLLLMLISDRAIVWIEINWFMLTHVLWIPASEGIFPVLAMIGFSIWSNLLSTEVYQYVKDPSPSRTSLGLNFLCTVTMAAMETLVVIRYDWDLVMAPFPHIVLYSWGGASVAFVLWICWRYNILGGYRLSIVSSKSTKWQH